jgi:hypothetical protein
MKAFAKANGKQLLRSADLFEGVCRGFFGHAGGP